MKIECNKDHKSRQRTYIIEISDESLADIEFDDLDRAVINSPVKHGSDILQSLQIMFFRYEQQFGSRKE